MMAITRNDLIELAKEESRRKVVLEAYAMTNVPQDPEQRVDLDAAYRVAFDEWQSAAYAYFEAQRRYRPSQEVEA